ncbi:MAG: hypothetical protein ACREGI_02665, partial [Candidatus Levyibacteriota bacterium]
MAYKMLSEIENPDIYGLVGFVFILISFLYWLFPSLKIQAVIVFHAFFYIGNILFFDAVSYKLTKFSFFHHRKNVVAVLSHLVILAAIFGFVIEFFYRVEGKLWYYPRVSLPLYLVIVLPGFILYTAYILETYFGAKAILEYFFFKHRRRKESFAGLKKIFLVIGVIGAVGIGVMATSMSIITTADGIVNGLF